MMTTTTSSFITSANFVGGIRTTISTTTRHAAPVQKRGLFSLGRQCNHRRRRRHRESTFLFTTTLMRAQKEEEEEKETASKEEEEDEFEAKLGALLSAPIAESEREAWQQWLLAGKEYLYVALCDEELCHNRSRNPGAGISCSAPCAAI